MPINNNRNKNNIELRSEEFREIIGTPPAKIVRIGIGVIFALIFMIIVGSFFFKYPDIISARISVLGQNPSADIKARANGKITDLFVSDKQIVEENETLAIIENTCNYEDLLALKSEMDSAQNLLIDFDQFIKSFKAEKKYQLGELQNDYSSFIRKIKEYDDFLKLDYHTKKIKAYKKQINAFQNYLSNQRRQVNLSRKDLVLSTKQLSRDSVLYIKEFLSESDYEKSKSVLILKKRNLEDSRSSISNSEIRLAELEQSLLETELQKIDQKREFEISINENFENLKAQIRIWEQNYLLKSPIHGTVSFTNFRNKNQNVSIGETVFTVIPDKSSELVGYAEIPLSGSGKVKKDQNVNIKFDDFPDTQFGMVRGKVESISLVQSNEFYMVKINFPDSLRTNYKKTLSFKQNMKGTADILTDDLPLIARLVNPIKSLFYEKL